MRRTHRGDLIDVRALRYEKPTKLFDTGKQRIVGRKADLVDAVLPERQLTRLSLSFQFSFQQIKFSALRADPNRDMLAVVGHGDASSAVSLIFFWASSFPVHGRKH